MEELTDIPAELQAAVVGLLEERTGLAVEEEHIQLGRALEEPEQPVEILHHLSYDGPLLAEASAEPLALEEPESRASEASLLRE